MVNTDRIVETNGAFVMAEVGCNHKGEMKIAFEMIEKASRFCEVDAVKFQKRDNKTLLTPEEYNAPHPNPHNSYGDTYGAHREFLEFDQGQHRELKQHCEANNLIYSTSVWDLPSAKQMAAIEPVLLKIPSAINTNLEVIDYLCGNFGGDLHISLGMTTKDEEKRLADLLDSRGRLRDTVLYHCTSGYPVEADELFLLEIRNLVSRYGNSVKAIGFSGHHNGIAADIAALTLGAAYFERHYTLNRTWKGTDHAASLEPDGMRRVARDLREVKKALKEKATEISPVEIAQRKKLKKFAPLAEDCAVKTAAQ